MHITHFQVFNYKSFSYQLIDEVASAGINIFLGINGSGKTSLFDAINSLFSEKFFSKRNSHRCTNLFGNKKHKNFYCLIQIFLDNKNRDFPICYDEIKLKRTIGFYNDKMLVNGHAFYPNYFFQFLDTTELGVGNTIFNTKQGDQSNLKYTDSFQRLKIFKKGLGYKVYEKYQKKSYLILSKTNKIKEHLSDILFHLQKILGRCVLMILFGKKTKVIKNFLFFFYFISASDKKKILKKKKKFVENYNEILEKFISALNTRIFFSHSDPKRLNFKRTFVNKKITKKISNNKNPCVFWINKEYNNLINCTFFKIENFFSLVLREVSKNNWLNFSQRFFTKNLSYIFLGSHLAMNINFFKRKLFIKKMHDIQKKDIKYRRKMFDIFTKKFLGVICSKMFSKAIDINTIAKVLFFRAKLSKLVIKRKIYFYSSEISTEEEALSKNLFRRGKNLEKKLGINNIKGIRNITFLLKKYPKLKSKLFGVFIDLFSVHKHFYRAVESFFNRFLNYIVIKDQESAIKIINLLNNQVKYRINFMVNKKKLEKNFKIKKFLDGIPLLSSLYFKTKFFSLFQEISRNSFIIKKRLLFTDFSKNSTLNFITLDGDILRSNGTLSKEIALDNNTIFDIIISLKKERLFFELIKSSNGRLFLLIKEFQLYFYYWWLLDKTFNKLKNNIDDWNFFKKKSQVYMLMGKNFFINTKKEKEFLKIKKNNNFLKLGLKKKIQKTSFFFSQEETDETKFIKMILYVNFKVFFFCNSFFSAMAFVKTKIKENFLVLHINYMRKYFYKAPKDSFPKKSKHPRNNFQKNRKKNFSNAFLILFNTKKKKGFLLIHFNIYRKILKEELKLFFQNRGKNFKNFCFYSKYDLKSFSYLLKFLFKKSKIQLFREVKSNSIFIRKIHNLILSFRKFETDFFVINQTFNYLEEKKLFVFNQSLEKISRKFSIIYKLVSDGKKACITIHFNENSEIFFIGKKFKKKITGVSICTKNRNEQTLNFSEQMSDGHVGLVFILLLISFREIIKHRIYFFDEIDTNIDPIHNKIISYLVKQISSSQIQFFIATFKKNLTLSGDKWIGISVKNSGTKLENVKKKNSFKFVTGINS